MVETGAAQIQGAADRAVAAAGRAAEEITGGLKAMADGSIEEARRTNEEVGEAMRDGGDVVKTVYAAARERSAVQTEKMMEAAGESMRKTAEKAVQEIGANAAAVTEEVRKGAAGTAEAAEAAVKDLANRIRRRSAEVEGTINEAVQKAEKRGRAADAAGVESVKRTEAAVSKLCREAADHAKAQLAHLVTGVERQTAASAEEIRVLQEQTRREIRATCEKHLDQISRQCEEIGKKWGEQMIGIAEHVGGQIGRAGDQQHGRDGEAGWK